MKVEFTFRSGARVIAEVANFYVDDNGSYVWVDLPEEETEGRRILADVNPKAVDAVVTIDEALVDEELMGLHQKITDRVTSEPCDCGADDDHGETVTTASAQENASSPVFSEKVERPAEGKGLTTTNDVTDEE